MKFGDWWRRGTISRGQYALIGLVGFAIKHNLDRIIARFVFGRTWSLFNYWVPPWDVARITDLRSSEAVFLESMVAISLPFIWIGVVLTMRRLRSAGLPLHLVALFFLPFVNLIFFAVLCAWPERQPALTQQAPLSERAYLARIIPESTIGSAAFALLFTVPIGLGLVALAVRLLAYGWGLFVALPFCIGMAAALIYSIPQPRSMSECATVACTSAALLGLGLFLLAFEGLFCLIMALPIALPLAAFGGVCGYFVQRWRWVQAGSLAPFLSVLLFLVPGVQWTEHVAAPRPDVFVVRSSIDIQASPAQVWKQVIAFTQIPPPTEWIFRSGIAYPIRAEIRGTGPGAQRRCVFSTGAFVEPIEVWDEPHRLKFSVTSNPPAMEEWSFYRHIEPPHLRGFLMSEGGQFLLTPLPNGGTHLEGTTWYQHGLWPASYWKLWSDAIIHRIHMRVLQHIKDEVENKADYQSQ